MTPTVQTTWSASDALCVHVKEKPLQIEVQSVAVELTLQDLPCRLVRSNGEEADATRCELILVFGDAALPCQALQLQLSSSARHAEIYADGVRRNLLGEYERSEVYLGTFRGTQATETQQFDVTEEFKPTMRDHDVLQQLYRLRIKFVSLVGDKKALELTKFRCFYITKASATAAAPASTPEPSAMPSAADVMSSMANLSLGQSGLNPQMLLLMVQQMIEREIETKITQALDTKLSVLAQRVAFAEQMLLQIQEKTTTKHTQLEQKLEMLHHQLGELRDQVNPKTDAAPPDDTEEAN